MNLHFHERFKGLKLKKIVKNRRSMGFEILKIVTPFEKLRIRKNISLRQKTQKNLIFLHYGITFIYCIRIFDE